ncbi:lysozyme inhibitor LprI family protein [Rhizobium sp. P28RR-XV]|uniref:lysozyme inhibitor LprI family protein n=1 Tax=Rhizobium sp. P28RR-XV TaxID=2726737 RepID=UPI0014572C14|nr:lysozyme inhibitor LprI family protein [Rhizobium sp. P28RR-XV]NLR89456.1 DUF1311 domain-containing protein [Rhizobium sp. P28RR-XV]
MNVWRGVLCRLSLSVLALSIPTLVWAQEQKTDCFGFDAVDDDPLAVQLYVIKPGDKVGVQCPEKSLICNKGAFLMPGDQVAVSRVDGDRACAVYLNPVKRPENDETAGWLPLARLDPISPVPNWVGRWGDSETTIVAKQQGDKIRIDAKANLQFGNGEEEGQFAALIDGRQSQVKFGYQSGDDGEPEKLLPYQDKTIPGLCQVKMAQLGRYLVVGDNHMCGGINVSFSRIYRRIDEKPPADRAKASKSSVAKKQDDLLRSSYKACLDKSKGVTVAMRNCAGTEHKFQDDRLNHAYRLLRTNLDQAGATQLRDEQRGWIAERDRQCAVDKDGGTAALIVSDDCLVQMTAKRAAELESRLSQ